LSKSPILTTALTLKRLNIKLIMNIHRPGAARFFGVGDDYLSEGIQVDTLKINGVQKPWDNKKAAATNQLVSLSKPLMPHDSVKLDVMWHYPLVTGHGREGVIDSTSFYLAYFYPRVSV
jgi:hypothetical protein